MCGSSVTGSATDQVTQTQKNFTNGSFTRNFNRTLGAITSKLFVFIVTFYHDERPSGRQIPLQYHLFRAMRFGAMLGVMNLVSAALISSSSHTVQIQTEVHLSNQPTGQLAEARSAAR